MTKSADHEPDRVDPRIGGIELQIESRRLHALLLLAGEFREAFGKCVCYSELQISA